MKVFMSLATQTQETTLNHFRVEFSPTKFKTFATSTRKAARTLVSTLKAQGFTPSTPTVKSGLGWLVATHKVISKASKSKVKYNVVNNQAVKV